MARSVDDFVILPTRFAQYSAIVKPKSETLGKRKMATTRQTCDFR
jgi:hypothetical protein